MRPVDYSQIASTYDELPIRTELAPDERLAAALARGGAARVLDVGCGTGSWLAAQAEAFALHDARWFGIDPAEAMLARARVKLPKAVLQQAPAEALPFPDLHVRFVACRFAYHHFRDLGRALDEMTRVLEPGGELLLTNVVPERMPGWWVFDWFPEAREYNRRYSSPERLGRQLELRGLSVELEVRVTRSEVSVAAALSIARTRDQSHLFSLDDDVYAIRLAALEAACQADPTRSLASESAVLVLYATRSRAVGG